jgi:hypothetical protein
LAEDADRRIITATGTASVRFKPDSVRIQCGVRNTDPQADAAKDAVQKSSKVLLDSLADLKLKDSRITVAPLSVSQTSSGRVRVLGGGGPGGGGAIMADNRPFTATQPVTIVVVEPDGLKLKEAVEKITKILIDNGANTNGGDPDDGMFVSPRYAVSDGPVITLLRRDDGEFRDEAMSQAVQKAMRTAKALAKGAGVQIKETVSISESEISPDGLPGRLVTSPRIVSGELEISVRVTVRCSY